MPTQYNTVYEITQRTPDWPFACIGLIPIIVGAVVIWGKRRFMSRELHWLFTFFCCLFGGFWVVVVGSSTLRADLNAFSAYQKGNYQIVEGVVTDFHPMPYEGHQDECFSVQSQRFCYSDYEVGPGFHNATSHGGPIRAGLAVRIAHFDGRILKLEVPNGQAPTPAQSAAITTEGQRESQQRAENDPFEQKMSTAFIFTGMCWTFWWNLQWKRVMRFWLKPPYRPWVETAFRIFFALNFLGALVGFAQQLYSHPLSRQNIRGTLLVAAIMCFTVALMSTFGLWMAGRRDAKGSITRLPINRPS